MNGKRLACYGLALLTAVAVTTSCRRSPRAESTPELIGDLRNNGRLKSQTAAARVLGERKDAQAVPALIDALKDAQPVRLSAVRALGNIGDERAVEPLIATLKEDTDPRVRTAAAQALGELRDERAVDALITALAAENEAAGPALVRIGAPAIAPLVGCLREAETRGVATQSLVQIGNPAVEPLIGALKTYEDEARSAAARALAEINDPRGNRALTAALRDGDPRLGAAAYKFLVRSGTPENETLLLAALHRYGHIDMAEDLLRSGRPELRQAAKIWAQQNGYTLTTPNPAGEGSRSRTR